MKSQQLLWAALAITAASVAKIIVTSDLGNLGTAGGFAILTVFAMGALLFTDRGLGGGFKTVVLALCLALSVIIALDVFLGIQLFGLAVI